MADFIPTTDADFGDWLTNLQAKTNATPAAYGLVAGDVTPLTAALADWNTKYPTHLNSQAQAKTDKAAKDTSRRTATTVSRAIARKANGSGLMTPTKAGELRVGIRDTDPTRVPTPTLTPQVLLDFGNHGEILVHAGTNPGNERNNGLPAGSEAILLQYVEGSTPPVSPATWNWLAHASNSPYRHIIGGSVPRTFTYRGCYVNRRDEQGPFSGPMTGTMTP